LFRPSNSCGILFLLEETYPTSDYQKVQERLNVPKHSFLKHVASRWLTLGTSVSRLMEQLPALREYFLKVLPAKKTCIPTERETNYIALLKDPTTVFMLEFVKYVQLQLI